ncbi:hypothetical protein JJB11_17485 [Ramlibacter ginsenosidimutans]|uniref:Protein tyrosine phosphatase n=1 Tax=Ramlibacter ginsenosidimutans TaxID=502333 RepID=A0A934WNT3_9BURK|nr:hypothetical protein [Ramlibacter ginsenosidimutans]MBK6007895.1 hypothetical protein [Ramlibacter ginsenosidimutans]
MTKLLAVLIAGLFSAAVFAQATPATPATPAAPAAKAEVKADAKKEEKAAAKTEKKEEKAAAKTEKKADKKVAKKDSKKAAAPKAEEKKS